VLAGMENIFPRHFLSPALPLATLLHWCPDQFIHWHQLSSVIFLHIFTSKSV